jgi:kumamolisin
MRMDSKRFAVSAVAMTMAFALNASANVATTCQLSTHVMKPLLGHIPAVVKELADIGKLDEQQVLPVTIVLHLNNEDELNARIADMYNPESATFHQFLTTEQFNDRYAPSEEQVASEKAFLESSGISVQTVSDNRVLMHAQANVETLNRVFKTEVHQYRHSSGEISFAPSVDLQAPMESQISAVVGLSNLAHWHNYLSVDTEHSLLGGGFTPADINKAYNIPNTVDGSGQTLALFELDGYVASDITGYEQKYGLPNVTLQNVLIDGSTGSAGQGAVEVVLDIEMMIAVAPKVSKIVVYEGPNSSQGLLDTYAKIASDNLAKQISSSWGESESTAAASDMNSENTIFKQMVAQGQSLFAASGDSGVNDTGSSPSVDDPAGQPYLIGVGGTKLTTNSDGSYGSETTWNELSFLSFLGAGAGGGGVSTIWEMPSWQQGAATSDSQFSTSKRNVPDVSLNADPKTGYAIYEGGKLQSVGGTSAAAPLWAAFATLVDQNRAKKGLSPLGFAAPAIYAIGKSSAYTAAFNDINDGSSNGRKGTGFKAVTGYDNATGWGSFKGAGLLEQLSQK